MIVKRSEIQEERSEAKTTPSLTSDECNPDRRKYAVSPSTIGGAVAVGGMAGAAWGPVGAVGGMVVGGALGKVVDRRYSGNENNGTGDQSE